MFNTILRYYHTLKFLKWIQVKYRLLYLIKRRVGIHTKPDWALSSNRSACELSFVKTLTNQKSFLEENTFRFLNITQRFETGIDWNCHLHGKLWTYNLNYFDFLLQPNMTKETGLKLIRDFIEKCESCKDGLEPFPVALRIIAWVKFISLHRIKDEAIDQALYAQLIHLTKNLEYHLLGNHLLENAFSLLFGAYYFDDESLKNRSEKLLTEQLTEQTLDDGAHFELSPMYHQIMLHRVLDAVNLLQNNPNHSKKLLELLEQKAQAMLSWMKQMTFADGSMPCVNDSAPDVAPFAKSLLSYADRLGLQPLDLKLADSGYRKYTSTAYELLVDVGRVGPDYIPGHAHSDTLSFVLHHQQQPLLVDTGISTYEKNERRGTERGTAAHNTVMLNGQEQSEVWGGFRMARRAEIVALDESKNHIQAKHDGYQRIGAAHQRTFELKEQSLLIKDKVSKGFEAKAFFHFHPKVKVQLSKNGILGDFGEIQFENSNRCMLQNYEYALGFNHTQAAQKAVVDFSDQLQSKIILS